MKWLVILALSISVCFGSGVMNDSEHTADAGRVYCAMNAVGMYPNVAVYTGDYYIAFVGEDFYFDEDSNMEVAAAIIAAGRVSEEASWTSGMLYIGYENWMLYLPTWRCRSVCGFLDAGTYSEDYIMDYIYEYTLMEPR